MGRRSRSVLGTPAAMSAAALCSLLLTAPAPGCPAGWQQVADGPNGPVLALAVLPDGGLVVGGAFSAVGGVPASGIARLEASGAGWSALGSGVTRGPGEAGSVSALATLPGAGGLVVGGYFTAAGGVPASRIARYEPGTGAWSVLGPAGSGVNSRGVFALAALPGGVVIAGGGFSVAGGEPIGDGLSMTGGVPVGGIARYSPPDNTWLALGPAWGSGFSPGVNGFVDSLAVLPGGDVIAGGVFSAIAGGVAAAGIARYRPSTDTWSPLNPAFGTQGAALAILPGGTVAVAGPFYFRGAALGRRMAFYDPVGDTWSPLTSTLGGTVSALAVLPDGDLVAGGDFTTAGGVSASRIARYHRASGAWSSLGPGTDGGVRALAVVPDAAGGQLIVAGEFATAGGIATPRVARYRLGSPCRADFDCSASVGVSDVFEFLNTWFASAPSDPRADIDANGVRDVADIFAFLGLWFAGC